MLIKVIESEMVSVTFIFTIYVLLKFFINSIFIKSINKMPYKYHNPSQDFSVTILALYIIIISFYV